MRCRGGSALLERAVPIPVSAQTSLFVAFVYSRVDIGQSLRLNACRLSCARRHDKEPVFCNDWGRASGLGYKASTEENRCNTCYATG